MSNSDDIIPLDADLSAAALVALATFLDRLDERAAAAKPGAGQELVRAIADDLRGALASALDEPSADPATLRPPSEVRVGRVVYGFNSRDGVGIRSIQARPPRA